MKTRKLLPFVAAVALLAGACGGATQASTSANGSQTISVAANTADAHPVSLTVPVVAEIRAQLPKKFLDRGKLTIGVGALPSGFPPLAYVGADQRTLTGAEPDLGRLVAAVLGLEPDVQNASWQNLFVRLQSGQFDAGFSNITVTEQRKQQGFDFAAYREDNLGFETNRASAWNFAGDYEVLAGKTVAVDSGTNQEKILREWQRKLTAEGKKLDVRNFADKNSTYLALASGRIDAYFAPNPGIAYHVAQTAKTPNPTRSAGKYSGAGATLQGLIAATTKKDNGLVKPVAAAIDYLIQHGQYAKWLAAYGLENEAVKKADINPPGLPLSDS
ncbi:ABC transporter substrate-binding protein [Amycolatopsis sp. AA4]|uniref:transporter substrate-binding domain-containing protein n=1 Tax=Actinomycetes TaxID=1760 RepID=UPI0001B53A3B|nr:MULTISPECIES: transporter substrate-binding domain-containing protein [Actinomycetes]ATY11455.1 ABC transporter substrate-binding protein [Amycolatopsis sp. AA4]EFL07080.1 ABC transporter substrate-binding protein [Streptomyces sp. AA4]